MMCSTCTLLFSCAFDSLSLTYYLRVFVVWFPGVIVLSRLRVFGGAFDRKGPPTSVLNQWKDIMVRVRTNPAYF